jgi:hypothetical protein
MADFALSAVNKITHRKGRRERKVFIEYVSKIRFLTIIERDKCIARKIIKIYLFFSSISYKAIAAKAKAKDLSLMALTLL